jgi:lariat debranching enzyme
VYGVYVGVVSAESFGLWLELIFDFRYHGGWLAPNIYYLGAAGSIYVHPTTAEGTPSPGIRLSGLSGIYKSFDYRRGHFERVPFNEKSVKSAYHVREYDVLKLKQVRF